MYELMWGTVLEREVEGFSYRNVHGEVDSVTVLGNSVVIKGCVGNYTTFGYEDIANLTKALNAAHKYRTGKQLVVFSGE